MPWSGPKQAFAVRAWYLARQGQGSEDIYVALRQFGVTMEYARSVVRKVEARRAMDREQKRAKREVA